MQQNHVEELLYQALETEGRDSGVELSQKERTIVFKYCIGHAVADCRLCAEGFRPHEPATDLSGNQTHLCPRCRTDLTDSIRAHLYGCAMLARPVRIRTRELREVTRKVIKQSQQPADHAGPLSRETEAILPPSGLAVGAF